jgi:hypothetical protein
MPPRKAKQLAAAPVITSRPAVAALAAAGIPTAKQLSKAAADAGVLFEFPSGPSGKVTYGKTAKAAMACAAITADYAGGVDDNKRLEFMQHQMTAARNIVASEHEARSALCAAAATGRP